MSDSTVILSSLAKGDRFRLPEGTIVYYKAYYSWSHRGWVCLHEDKRVQKIFEPTQPVLFLRHA